MSQDKGARSVTGNVQLNKGFLLYWTIHSGVYPVQALLLSSAASSLPLIIYENLSGADPRQAWNAATRVKEAGIASVEIDKRYTARYTTKDSRDAVRLLIREKIDTTNDFLLIQHMGILNFDGSFKFTPDPSFEDFKDEAGTIVNAMIADYNQRVGNLTDVIIRTVLSKWLVSRFRITIRESGGVYYLPNTGPNVEQEILNVHRWMLENSVGQIYSFEIFDTTATSLDGLIEQAQAEISAEAAEMEKKINSIMTAYKADLAAGLQGNAMASKTGSYAYTMEQYETALEQMQAKLAATEGSLGTVLGQLSARMAMMKEQAKAVKVKAKTQVQAYRKATGKPLNPAPTKKQKQAQAARQIAQQGRNIQ